MKKINRFLLIAISLFLLVGCGNMMNTPTKKVEEFLSKYQTLDKDVIDQLDTVIDDSDTFDDEQKEKYHDLMKNQYKNLSYKIKDETEDGDNATVVVEIEVLDYGKAMSEAETYLANNREEFLSTTNNTPNTNNNTNTENDATTTETNNATNTSNDTTTNNAIDKAKFLTYKIKQMANVKDKVTYTINFRLTKIDDKWQLNDISDIDRLKLHGLYY